MTRTKQEVYQGRCALLVSGSQLVGVEGSGFFCGSGLFYLFVFWVLCFGLGPSSLLSFVLLLIRSKGLVVVLPWLYQALRLLLVNLKTCIFIR